MIKKRVLLIAILGLGLQLTSCTSNESKSDVEEAQAGDVSAVDESTLNADPSVTTSDQLSEDALAAPATDPAAEPAPVESAIVEEEKKAEEAAPVAEATSEMPPLGETPAPAPTVDATPVPAPVAETPAAPMAPSEETPKAPVASLQKIKSEPWQAGKKWVNAIYFARPGDSLSSISQMIYGSDKVSHLKQINPTYKNRDIRPGDKIYYSSPNRPDDSQKMLTYYEDNGLAPEVYVAQKGDNIRKLSKNLLGYSAAWKEVWASNPVESKSEIEEGTELRYWKGAAPAQGVAKEEAVPAQAAPADVANAQMPPPAPAAELPPPPAPEMTPPPPEADAAAAMAQAEMPPPPPAAELPPPPPVEAVAPPPPPVAKEAKEMKSVEEEAMPMDDDTMMSLGAVAIAAAGLAAFMVIRKKRRQRQFEQSMETTHVGT